MIILAVETSCDETAAAVVENGRTCLSSAVLSQTELHAVYGGVVPEVASRHHVESIGHMVDKALADAGVPKNRLDAVAVTCAPGLIGALLVGLGFAKAYAFGLGVPLIPVHHLRAHIAANYLAFPELEPPFLCLVASGGHTSIVDVRGYTDMAMVGQTRDDAAGEAFDKVARVLGAGYPGGPAIDALALAGDDAKYPLPRATVSQNPYDMSFSGLKTAVVNLVHTAKQKGEALDFPSLAASFQAAVSDTLVPRFLSGAQALGRDTLAFAGGVAANSRLRRDLERACRAQGRALYLPPLSLCGDNAAMVGAQGYYEYLAGVRGPLSQNAYATMEICQNFAPEFADIPRQNAGD